VVLLGGTSLNLSEVLRRSQQDPLLFFHLCWPEVSFYESQRQIILSVRDNDETFVPAGNKLGKDFVAGGIVLWFFLTRSPCRVVTTSAKDDHLKVLWGEIGRFLQTSRIPLTEDRGGPLLMKHQDLRKLDLTTRRQCPISYLIGMVASSDTMAAMQGHHANPMGLVTTAGEIVMGEGARLVEDGEALRLASADGVPRTLFVADEASSVPDAYWTMARTWCKRALVIGNPWECHNFFKHAVKGRPGPPNAEGFVDRGGDLPDLVSGTLPDGRPRRYYRRVIRIRAEDSPNVRYGLAEQAQGIVPSDRVLVPGVKTYGEYRKDRATLDARAQCVSLDASFYEGAEVMLYPAEWLAYAEQLADHYDRQFGSGPGRRVAKGVGVDPAEGGDRTCIAVVDELGVLELISMKTPDTSVIPGAVLAVLGRWRLDPARCCFDRGGGGKQHADTMNRMGHRVRSVGFGESVQLDPRRGMTRIEEKLETKAEHYAYVNRRAEMYGMLRQLLDPNNAREVGGVLRTVRGFALPGRWPDLRAQLEPLPLWYDKEGRLTLPPKHRRGGSRELPNEVTMESLLGRSPDEADAVVLAVHAMTAKPRVRVAGAY
jgi:hypothetical protein